MELIEIRNNLIKLAYKEDEKPTLGHFVALTSDDKSYVAQFVNLKADDANNFAVARLIFSFNSEGIVSEYDGSIPSMQCNMVNLPANELLALLPLETPLKIGQVSGTEDLFSTDISIFEHNLTVFSENDFEKVTFISNCVRQLFRLKEKSVIIDIDSIFEDYPKITVGNDFKLPLNSDFIDFLFENELKEVDAATKAVIQDVFYAVQQYIKTLDEEFLPIDNFIDVVTAQYKETQMPELALLKNKLLKYKEADIFANEADEFKIIEEKLKERNCTVVDLKNVSDSLQKEIISYIHKTVDKFDKYVYYFVPLNDWNSDKKLIKRFINHNHIFTTIFVSHKYKYASELKSHAQNIIFFAPQTVQHDFAAYNTFLNKLNPSEGIIYGKLTQGIPLIITLDDLDLDLTKDDVFGDRQRFVSAIEESSLDMNDVYAINNLQEAPELNQEELYPQQYAEGMDAVYPASNNKYDEDTDAADDNFDGSEDLNNQDSDNEEVVTQNDNSVMTTPVEVLPDEDLSAEALPAEELLEEHQVEIANEEIETIEDNENQELENEEINDFSEDVIVNNDSINAQEDDLSFMDEFNSDEELQEESNNEDFPEDIDNFGNEVQELPEEDVLNEDDLDLIDSNNQVVEDAQDESVPVVPIYNTEEESNLDEQTGFSAGDRVTHPRYGNGVVEKIIKYGNKILCSIDFENVGRRLLDPSVSDFQKIQ